MNRKYKYYRIGSYNVRYLGNKTKLLHFLVEVMRKYNIEGDIFADLFAGTGSVGDYFKGTHTIISNDFLYYSYVINQAKLMNNEIPRFTKFKTNYGEDLFDWMNKLEFEANEYYFVYNNYSPKGERMFFTEENAIKIDGLRIKIEELLLEEILEDNEYYFVLASLLESVTKFSNTSGTYEAFFKFWESRATKDFKLLPLEMNETLSVSIDNKIYKEDTNKLVRSISGDIAYIDTPYTVTQYVSAYHMLETIAKYDFPEITGVGGKRGRGEKNSLYARKKDALIEFEDLFRQLDFTHVLISYSTHALVPIEELVNLAKKFALKEEVFVEKINYTEYKNHRTTNKKKDLQEVIIYFKKDLSINKSPLNYSGSKDTMVEVINKELPKHVGTFVDVMGGAFNVGANVVAMNKVIYNEINPYIFEIIEWTQKTSKIEQIKTVKSIIERYNLMKKDKESYLSLRDNYNNNGQHMTELFVLHMYSFQNMIRFNNSKKFNTPNGVAAYSNDLESRMKYFHPKTKNIEMINKDYNSIEYNQFTKDTVFYFDPPYFITSAAYNDGKRGMKGWNSESEIELLNVLLEIDKMGFKFLLSNVIEHNSQKNHILENWVEQHGFQLIDAGTSGWRYRKKEVLIKNYN